MVHILWSSYRQDNGVNKYRVLYSGSLSSFSSLCGWWGERAAVRFYEPRALEEISSNPLSRALMRSTHEEGGSWRSVGVVQQTMSVLHDGYKSMEQRCLQLYVFSLL